jgi:hypothetical protein
MDEFVCWGEKTKHVGTVGIDKSFLREKTTASSPPIGEHGLSLPRAFTAAPKRTAGRLSEAVAAKWVTQSGSHGNGRALGHSAHPEPILRNGGPILTGILLGDYLRADATSFWVPAERRV